MKQKEIENRVVKQKNGKGYFGSMKALLTSLPKGSKSHNIVEKYKGTGFSGQGNIDSILLF